jgi:hypothetical protein
MTDYRAELQRLVKAYDEHGGKWPDHHEQALFQAVQAARTALAQPEPEALRPDRYELGDAIRRSWLKRGQDSWCSIADDVLAELPGLSQPEPEVAGSITDGRPMNQSYWLALLRHDAYAASFQSVDQYRSALIERASSPRAQPEPEGVPADEDLYDLADVFNGDPVPAMRRALELWGRPAIEPVPVAERLPGPEDCDARGWCWYWHPGEECWEMVPVVTGTLDEWTHWLPHHALPVPGAEVG